MDKASKVKQMVNRKGEIEIFLPYAAGPVIYRCVALYQLQSSGASFSDMLLPQSLNLLIRVPAKAA